MPGVLSDPTTIVTRSPPSQLLREVDSDSWPSLRPLDPEGTPFPAYPGAFKFADDILSLSVLGPRFGGVTWTLRYLADEYITSTCGAVESRWIDCRHIDTSRYGILDYLAKHLGVAPARTIGDIARYLADQPPSDTEFGNAARLIVIDEVDALPARDSVWLMKSLHSLQAQRALVRGAFPTNDKSRVCFLVGGSVGLESAIVGEDSHRPSAFVVPPVLAARDVIRLNELARDRVGGCGVELCEDVAQWLAHELRGDLMTTLFAYDQILDYARLGEVSEIGIAEVATLLTDTRLLEARFALDLRTMRAVWARFAEMREFVRRAAVGDEVEAADLPPATRQLLFRIGCLRLMRGKLEVRNRLVVTSICKVLEEAAVGVSRATKTAAFLKDTVGVSVDDLEKSDQKHLPRLLREIVCADLEGVLRFLYYGTVETITDESVVLRAESGAGREYTLQLSVADIATPLHEGDVVLYSGRVEGDDILVRFSPLRAPD